MSSSSQTVTVPKTSKAKPAPPPFLPEELNEQIEVLAPSKAGGSTFHAKVKATSTLYRFEPMRYPREPRVWCVSVSRCSPGGNPNPDEPAWIGHAGLAWNELAKAMDSIRADLGAWLAAPDRHELCRWLLTAPKTA